MESSVQTVPLGLDDGTTEAEDGFEEGLTLTKLREQITRCIIYLIDLFNWSLNMNTNKYALQISGFQRQYLNVRILRTRYKVRWLGKVLVQI